jgi:hypothetical protein
MSFTGSLLCFNVGHYLFSLIPEGPVMAGKTTSLRYSENPFIEDMIVPIRDQQVKLSRLGKDDNILINQSTGEERGTHVTTYRKVDADKFVKLFAANIAMTFDLNAAGIKVFNVLIWIVQNKAIGKDLLPLDTYSLDEFISYHQDRDPPIKLSYTVFKRGLLELERAQIIAKSIRPGWYFINPNFCFNGDRIAFTTLIEKE